MTDLERFAALCEEEASIVERGNGEGIGTYGEKRLHRILKRFVCDDVHAWEVPVVGRYVADVLTEGQITEIQTGSFRPLTSKLRAYLERTDYGVTVVHPILAEKTIYRMDRESGELHYKKRSPKRGRAEDILPQLYWLGELLPDPRLTVKVLLIRADEHRFSERMRYRKEGAYESELYPRELLECVTLQGLSDYEAFLPPDSSFTAAEYGKFSKLRGRNVYSALNFFCAVGLLRREKEGNHYRYFRT